MKTYLDSKVIVIVGDITKQIVDAIVNAANSNLQGGGGVDGAIHRAGGHVIIEECREIIRKRYPSGLPAGESVATGAGDLRAKYVIHTVGPVWYGGKANEEQLLAACYANSLKLADGLGCKTIAFPAISTGAYGFPFVPAVKIASSTIKKTLAECQSLEKVMLVFFSQADYNSFILNQEF